MNHDARVKRCQVRPIPAPPYITEAPPEPDLTSGTPTAHMNRCQLAASEAGATLFRNAVAFAWVGKVIRRIADRLVLERPRAIQAGLCEGSSDLIGWTPVTITPEMVGETVAVFTAFEVKLRTGRPDDGQRNFITRVQDAGGIAAVVKTPEQAREIVTRCKRGKP